MLSLTALTEKEGVRRFGVSQYEICRKNDFWAFYQHIYTKLTKKDTKNY